VKPLAVDTADAHLEMRGSLGFARMESTGEFDVRIDEPGRLAPLVPADWHPTGSIAAKGSWSGRLDRPRVSARLTGEELIANGLHFKAWPVTSRCGQRITRARPASVST
jgi:autotransporter translocation and assembly factor TamB